MSTKRVLLILEDFDELRSIVASCYFARGYEIFSSATLLGALAIAKEELPNTVIIDNYLKGKSMLGVIEQLRAALPQSTILAVGAAPTPEREEQALKAGASQVLARACDVSFHQQIEAALQ